MIPKEKSGYLDVKLPSKLKSLKWKVWHHRWVVLHQLTDLADEKPIVRLTFYPNDDNRGEGQGQRRERCQTVYLEDINSVTRVKSRTRRYAFAVTVGRDMSSAALLLAGNSESQSQSWMAVLRSCSGTRQPQRHLDIGEVYQDAYLIDGDASLSLGLTGHYLLVVSQNALSLYSPVDGQLCQEWRLNHLQRYGVDEQTVAMEDTNRILTIVANRLCPTGEGTFSFFMADAQEVLSQITTSIQRTLSKTTHQQPTIQIPSDPLSINNPNDNANHRLARASSCRLPRRAYINNNNNNSDDVLHKRQGSLPCDVERVAFRDGSYSDSNMDILMRIRRGTNSSYSDDNSKMMKLKSKRAQNGKRRDLDLNQNIEKKEGGNLVPPTSPGEALSQTIPVNTSGLEESTPQSKIIETRIVSPGLNAIIADNTSLTTPSYFRRPSWYSDTTNGDVESSSSEDYRELYNPGRRSLPQPCHRHRASSMATSQSSSYGSWIDPRGVLPQRRHQNWRLQKADDISIGSTSSNEADDEVDIDSDGDVKSECLLRKSSANSHLYQELPEVNQCNRGEHSHCQLCYKPPATPPELPPRCDVHSPVQSETSGEVSRCKAASECSPLEHCNKSSTGVQRRRSVSESQTVTGKPCQGQGRIISSKDLCKEVKEMIPKAPEMPSRLNRNVPMRRQQKSGKEGVDLNRKVPVPTNEDKQENEYLQPQKNPVLSQSRMDDAMRKVSVLSGLYQDIDSLDEGEECHCHSDKERPSTPPEPPPRNKNSRHADNQKQSSRLTEDQEDKSRKHSKDQEYYEDLDRFRKNIHKYLGIPLTDVNPPPPLPHRPLSLPAVSQVRQRTKSKLRSLGRKKKAQSTGDTAVSSSQTTDDNSSVDPRLRRVSAWPFRFGSLSRGSKLNSLVSDNSFYSTREQFKPQPYPSVIDNQYPSFCCSSCGASNQLYANVLPPANPHPVPYPYYPQIPPPPPRPIPTAMHRRYASTPSTQPTVPNPFHELLRPPLQPWMTYDEQEREHLLQERYMWSADSALSDAPSQSVCESTASSSVKVAVTGASSGVPYKEPEPTDSASDIYTDMSGVAEAMYIPMVPVADPASTKSEPIYVNWPADAQQSEA